MTTILTHQERAAFEAMAVALADTADYPTSAYMARMMRDAVRHVRTRDASRPGSVARAVSRRNLVRIGRRYAALAQAGAWS